jgi:MFS family permease
MIPFIFQTADERVRRNFRRDFTASLLGGIFERATTPFIALIAARDLGLPAVYISVIVAASSAASLLALPWVKLTHGLPKLRVVVWSTAASRAMLLPLAFGVGPPAYVALVCLSFVLGVVSVPAYSSICKAIYPERDRGSMLAYVRSAPLITGVPTALAAGWALTRLGPLGTRVVFPVAALIGIAALRVFSRIEMPPEDPGEGPRPGVLSSFKILGRDRAFRTFAIAVSTYGFGNLVVGPLYVLYQANVLKVTNQQQGVLTFLGSGAMLVSLAAWGRLVDWMGSRRCLGLSVFLVFVLPFAYFWARTTWGLIPAFIIQGVGFAGVQLTYMTSILEFASEQEVGQYQAIHTTLLGIRGLLAAGCAPLLLRALAPTGDPIRIGFLVCAAVIFIGFLLQFAPEIGARFANLRELGDSNLREDTADKR